MATKLYIVGGFLGAGKTTMLGQLAKQFSEEGKKVGLITNDQASGLVDTKYLENAGGAIREVSGICFCCNFNGFTDAIEALIGQGMDTVIAEPVGSCTDLSATIMQPLKDKFSDRLSIAPLSVLCDVNRVDDILNGGTSGLHKSAAYIVKKQLEEADYIVVNKSDLVSETKLNDIIEKIKAAYTKCTDVFGVSALTKSGISDWIKTAESADFAGTHILTDIDYDTYAEGEAVLGWLNASIALNAEGIDWNEFLETLMKNVSNRFETEGHSVGHVKALITEPTNFVVANLVGRSDTFKIRGKSEKAKAVNLIFNARVEMSPEALETEVREEFEKLVGNGISYEINEWKCLMPGRPNPTHRYKEVV